MASTDSEDESTDTLDSVSSDEDPEPCQCDGYEADSDDDDVTACILDAYERLASATPDYKGED